MSNAIAISKLKFGYSSERTILEIDDLRIQSGEKVFLFGESGSGKTSLLGLMAGVLAGYEGEISILDQPLSQLTSAGRDQFRGLHMGYIFQLFNLIPYLSVEENIALGCRMNADRMKKISGNLTEHIRDLARDLGIENLLSAEVTKLSVGQQQRVAVARALLGRPEIIIADEPTSALDADHREKFLSLLFSQCEKHKTTLVFVSHDRSLSKSFDRVISISDINRAGRA